MVNVTMENAVSDLLNAGFFNILLPFGIFFLILFGILDRYAIISKDKKVNAALSLLISAFIMLYAYMNNIEIFFSEFYMKMSVVLLILLFAITFAVFIYRALETNNLIPQGSRIWSGIIIFISVLIMTVAFENVPGKVGVWAQETSSIVLIMGILGAIFGGFEKKGGSESGGGGGEG